jgi:hypothetical protein
MPSTSWLIVATLVHAVLVAVVAAVVFRTSGYKNSQRLGQIALAAAVPIFGTVLVLVMAREAVAEPPKSRHSGFDPQDYNGP